MISYNKIQTPFGVSTIRAEMDFETYSEAGYIFDESANKWRSISKSPPHGIGAVGAAAYSEHPSTEALCLSYNLKQGAGNQLWTPSMKNPQDLFDFLAAGGEVEAVNSSFEWFIWNNVCVRRYGWPQLNYWQIFDTVSKAKAMGYPASLKDMGGVLNIVNKKKKEGKNLIQKYCKPRNPTKNNRSRRNYLHDNPVDEAAMYAYCIGDISAEAEASSRLPDLSTDEQLVCNQDQRINLRGVSIDIDSLENCVKIVNEVTDRLNTELSVLTGGQVPSGWKVKKLTTWLREIGFAFPDLKAETIAGMLAGWNYPDEPKYVMAKRALEIRSIVASASVKKVHALKRRVSRDGRMRGLFLFCGADQTGRASGRGPQAHNMPKSGPPVYKCGCKHYYGRHRKSCPWCGLPWADEAEWNPHATEDTLRIINTGVVSYVEDYFGDPLAAVSGCLRGLYQAADGCELICSDYNSIEARVLSELAGENWRREVFQTHGKIYEMSAAKITGIPFETILQHKKDTGEHHPLRKLGKTAELSSGYQGAYGAWINFGAGKHLTDPEIKEGIKAWRRENPKIVKFWYGLQDAATAAIQNPGSIYDCRGIKYFVHGDVLHCRLFSGRHLHYHNPRLVPDVTPWGKQVLKITYWGWNSDSKKGPTGWMCFDTYGGMLCGHVTQATARDILMHAMVNLERAGYPIVLHIHDEAVAEIIVGTGSIEEFERIMEMLPAWCKGWPIKASGGWRGRRYRKE